MVCRLNPMSFDTLPDGGVQMYGEKAKATRQPLSLAFAIQICKHFCKVPKNKWKKSHGRPFFCIFAAYNRCSKLVF